MRLPKNSGDLLLHIVFQAQLGKEQGTFDINSVIQKICDKLIRRHPHVFGNQSAASSAEVIKNWEAIKAEEKAEKLKHRSAQQRSLAVPSKLGDPRGASDLGSCRASRLRLAGN